MANTLGILFGSDQNILNINECAAFVQSAPYHSFFLLLAI